VRAYAINEADSIGYDNMVAELIIGEIPSVETKDVFDIGVRTVKVKCEITANEEYEITERGVCWNKTGDPVIDKDYYSTTIIEDNNNEFNIQVQDLSPGTCYYVRAFATNNYGTGYGMDTLFHTSSGIPEVSETEITMVQSTSLVYYGDIISDGEADIIERGVCWNTIGEPTVFDNKVPAELTEDSLFTVTVSGLISNTHYYLRAYATKFMVPAIAPDWILLPPPVLSLKKEHRFMIRISINTWEQ